MDRFYRAKFTKLTVIRIDVVLGVPDKNTLSWAQWPTSVAIRTAFIDKKGHYLKL